MLTEDALAWVSPFKERLSPLLGQFEDVVKAVAVIFDDPSRECTAEAALQVLWQGQWPVAKYTAEF